MNLEQTKTIIEQYELKPDSRLTLPNQRRSATITLTNGTFNKCEYKVSGSVNYDFDDWMFLLKVAQKIKELQEEKGDK